MKTRKILQSDIARFKAYLLYEEKSPNTIEKYIRDVTAFYLFAGEKSITKDMAIQYKQSLLDKGYWVSSINSMLASVNSMFAFLGWSDYKVKAIKTQRQIYCPEEKELSREEYKRLVKTAEKTGNKRLCLILQTICSMGIRVSEVQYVTVEAVKSGKIIVTCKGKTRTVFIVKELREKLLRYIKEQGIESGSIFVAKTGRPMSRVNIWREMKSICKEANVDPGKVFPHNLRHLFARIFYQMKKDIAKLADILGHSSIDTTRIYIMTTGKEHARDMEEMGLVFHEQVPKIRSATKKIIAGRRRGT